MFQIQLPNTKDIFVTMIKLEAHQQLIGKFTVQFMDVMSYTTMNVVLTPIVVTCLRMLTMNYVRLKYTVSTYTCWYTLILCWSLFNQWIVYFLDYIISDNDRLLPELWWLLSESMPPELSEWGLWCIYKSLSKLHFRISGSNLYNWFVFILHLTIFIVVLSYREII